MDIDISDLDKAAVLAALYNHARPLRLGVLHYVPSDLPIDEARQLLEQTQYFDYLHGRVMKVDLSGDSFAPRLYDRDNGEGAAFCVVRELRHLTQAKSA